MHIFFKLCNNKHSNFQKLLFSLLHSTKPFYDKAYNWAFSKPRNKCAYRGKQMRAIDPTSRPTNRVVHGPISSGPNPKI